MDRNLGGRIRAIRRQRRMTLDDLAGGSGLTKSYLSKVERGVSVPSISTALKVAESFQLTIGQLLGEAQSDAQVCIDRAGGRKPFMTNGKASGHNYQPIAAARQHKSMQPFIMRPPHEFQDELSFNHTGEELVFVLSGRVELWFRDRQIVIDEGDAVYFDGSLPHRLRSLSRNLAEVFVVVDAPDDLAGG